MAADDNDNKGISVSVPMSLIAAGVAVISGAAAAYILANRSDDESVTTTAKGVRRSGRSFGRRLGLRALIALIENDASRKIVVAALKAMARRT